MGGVGPPSGLYANQQFLYSAIHLPLVCCLIFFLLSFYHILFMTEKYAKGPGTWQKQSQQPFAHAAMASIRPAVACHKQLFVQTSGIKELAFHAITATLICTAQTAFILFPLPERLFAVFLIVPEV